MSSSNIEENIARIMAEAEARQAEQDRIDAEADDPEAHERKQQLRQLRADAEEAVDAHVATLPRERLADEHRAFVGSEIKKQLAFDDAHGEIGLGKQFALIAYGQHFRYIPGEKLLVKYDPASGIYREASADAAQLAMLLISATIDVARRMLRSADRNADAHRDAMKAFAKAQSLQRARTITAMLDVARSNPLLRVDLREFDNNPDELVVQNGVVHLPNSELRPHTPQNLARKSAGARYDPEAQCPKWERFLLQIMCGDQELVRYLQRAIGYTLTGHVRDEVMFFMYGGGSNGKSVIANVLQRMLGAYYVRVQGDFLMMQQQSNREGATPTMAGIAGARLVSANEVESGATLSGQQVKTLVSTEAISARGLHKEPFDFIPTHKLWLRGNHKPIVRDTDDGLWRRVHLIPFLMNIPKEQANLRLFDELCEELPGILRWAVEGARAWYAEGRLMPARAVVAATAEYQEDSDIVERWITDCYRRKEGAKVDAAVAYQAYCEWARAENIKAMSRPALTRRLEDKGIGCEKKRLIVGGPQVRVYVGLEVLV